MAARAEVHPTFFIIGVPKAGTSSLVNYLDQHPEIYMSKDKEPRTLFYEMVDGDFIGPTDAPQDRDRRMSRQAYLELFNDGAGAKERGESSFYLYSDQARENIQKNFPDAKFIVIFRNPVDRAYSNFMHTRRKKMEPVADFREALAEEPARIEAGRQVFWRYRGNGLYTERLKKYFSVFERERFYLQTYDVWQADNQRVLREMFAFLGVDLDFEVDTSIAFNKGGASRISLLGDFLYNEPPIKIALEKTFRPLIPKAVRAKLWSGLTEMNLKSAPGMEPELRRELVDFYREDILELQALTGLDVSGWLE